MLKLIFGMAARSDLPAAVRAYLLSLQKKEVILILVTPETELQSRFLNDRICSMSSSIAKIALHDSRKESGRTGCGRRRTKSITNEASVRESHARIYFYFEKPINAVFTRKNLPLTCSLILCVLWRLLFRTLIRRSCS